MNSDDLHRLIEDLSQAGVSIATAESLTGGALCARLVDVPGASTVVRGGVCTYATDLKASVLGVDADLLARRGPVDAEVALQMARGVRALMGADIGVSTTGVAGPGPADGHDAGTVHIAVSGPGGEQHRELRLAGERAQIRALSVDAALHLVRSVLDSGDRGAGD